MKVNRNFLFGLAVFSLFLIVFRQWFLSPVIASGDNWYFFKPMFNNHFIYPYSWYEIGGLGEQGFAFINVNMIAGSVLGLGKVLGLGWEIVARLFFYIPFIVLSFLSSVLLIKKLFPENHFWYLAPVIFGLNSYILMMTGGGQIITGLSYGLSPVTLYLFIRLIELRENKRALINLTISSALLLALQAILDLRIAFVTTVSV